MYIRLYCLIILAIAFTYTADKYKLLPQKKTVSTTYTYLLSIKDDLAKRKIKWSNEDLKTLAHAIDKYSEKRGLDKRIVLGIINKESRWRRYAIGQAGERSLMQVYWAKNKDKLAEEGIYSEDDLMDIDNNINGGTRILHDFLKQNDGRIVTSLWCYNGRGGRVTRNVSDILAYQDGVLTYAYNINLR